MSPAALPAPVVVNDFTRYEWDFCSEACFLAWLAKRGARPIGVDITPAQLATARRLMGETGIEFPLIEADAAETGLPDDLILTVQASAQHQNTPLYPIIRTLEQRIGIRKDEGAEANSARLREFLA